MSLLICDHVSLAYDGKTALSDVDFAVESGDYLCIIGENGAGKSTLMKGLLRLKKPTTGEIRFGDGLQPGEIGYLPQQTIVQKDFSASVWEVILSGCCNRLGMRPFYGRENRERARDAMRRMGIEHLEKRCYRELSGGQQQRVLLARALCATQKLLLLDEPVAGLDPVVTQEMYALIEDINREMGVTVIMVSHDAEAALRYGRKILHLCHKQVFFGTTEAYQQTEICRAFLGRSPNAGREGIA